MRPSVRLAFALLSIGILAPQLPAADPVYDLVIRSGRVVDGSGNPWYQADVAINADRIAAIGTIPKGSGRTEIDASGLVVAPGFIDIHSHSDFLLLEDGHAQSKIRQGVTTEILGEGSSAAPNQGRLAARIVRIEPQGADPESLKLATLEQYFAALERYGTSVNVATYVGLNNLWQSVMGTSFDRPTADELHRMQELLDASMQAGALGLSSQVMMPPGSLATTDDLVQLCSVIAPYHGRYSTHIRNEGLGVFESVKEAIRIGEEARVGVDIIHLKIADEQYWGRMDEVVELIVAARDRGVDVQANVYPYTRGNNNLVSIIPPWAHEGGRAELLKRLRDPELRARMKHDIRNGIDGWYNHYSAVGGDWSRMLISGDNLLKGLTMDRIMTQRIKDRRDVDELDELFDLLLEMGGSVSTVYAHHTEEDMTLALRQPWCSVGSDGSAYAVTGPLRRGNPHPRNFGTFPRILGVYVREQKLLSLEEAVRKMTSLNAAKVGIMDRGLLRPGLFADLTLFDPDRILDRSTYTDPFQYPDGIEHVIVNGRPVILHGEHTDERPGRALRRKPAQPLPPARQ